MTISSAFPSRPNSKMARGAIGGWLATAFIGTILSIAVHAAPSDDDANTEDLNGPPMGQMPAVAVSSTYRLSPYDVIDCSVYGEKQLHTRARLGADGTVLLPLIGAVNLEGLTVARANELIQGKYGNGLVENPHVLLTVVEYRKNTFRIIGQVLRPGIYEIPEGTHLTVVDAILLAGGFTRIADQNGVRVKRTIEGKSQVYKIRAGAMADSQSVAPFEIEPDDMITVKESWW